MKTPLLQVLLLLLAATFSRAETAYPLVNPSFEVPALSSSNSWYGAVSGWGYSAGVGTTWEQPFIECSPAPDGDQYLYGDWDGFDVYQQTGTLAANTRYRLLVDLFPLSTGTSRASVWVEETDTWSAVFAQAHFHPTWEPAREDFTLPAGQWTTVEVRLNSASFPGYVGSNFRIHINGHRLAVDNVRLLSDNQPRDFHVSSSVGNDLADGRTPSTAWASFANLPAHLPLLPGERILLLAGDTFTEELNVRGKGTALSPVEVTRYGTGPNPVIRRSDVATDRCLVWNNASHARIAGIDAENAKLGVYLRYEWTDSGSQNVTIEDCDFRDFPDPTLDPAAYNYEYAWSNAIFLGGQPWNQAELSTRLDGLTIRNVTATNAAHLFGTGWYYPQVYRSRLRNLVMEDCHAFNCLMGSVSLISVDGGHMKRVHAIGGGGRDTWSGSTLGMIQSSANFLVEDCEFAFIDRAQAGDGSGMDFEGNTLNVTMRGCTIHHCDASAILVLSTDGPHQNLVIEDNTFYNNALDPWNSAINSEIQGSNAAHTGIIRDNGIYRARPEVNFLSPTSNWSGFSISNNRQLEHTDVSQRPVWWNFDNWNDLEGWNTFNQWAYNTVSDGVLWGQSQGGDPYGHSPATWASSTLSPIVWVRMSQTAGSWAQVFFITETDPVFNEAKSVAFPIIADGQMHDYFVDIDANPLTMGVVTQVRLDPTTVAMSNMAVDFVRLTGSVDPAQPAPPAPAPPPQVMTFTSIAAEDGEILESAWNSNAGGTVNAGGTTFRLGDDSSNRAYRQFLSFDTSALPDDAVVVEATVGMTRVGSITGSIPIGVADSPWGDLLVDVVTGSFGASALATSDWGAAATKWSASKYAWPAYEDGMTIYARLESADNGLINVAGRTQFRVRYQNDDDGDYVADHVTYATANNSNAAARPTLTVKYHSNTPAWQTLLYDDFEAGWGNWIDGGADCTRYTGGTYSPQGAASADIQDNSGVASSFSSISLDLHNPGYTELQVDFQFYALSMESGENFFVEYFDGAVWQVVADLVVGTGFANNSLNTGTVLIQEQFLNFPTNARIRFRCDASNDSDDIFVDTISVRVR